MTRKPKFRILFIAVLAVAGMTLAGCTRCVNCSDCPQGVQLESEEMCENEFNSEEDFQQAVELAESFGCTCQDV